MKLRYLLFFKLCILSTILAAQVSIIGHAPQFTNQRFYLWKYEDFISDADTKTVGLMKYYKVTPTIADDIKQASFWAILGSLIVVFLYILIRFLNF